MIPKENRLRGEKQFLGVFRKGKTCQTEGLRTKILPSRQRATKIGIIVSLKFSKKATERNRAKRVIRAGARDILPKLKQPLDLVIIPLKKEITVEEVKEGLLKCLKPWL